MGETGPIDSEHIIYREWAFLNYAVTFWLHHFSRASHDGADGSEVEKLLHSEPDLVHIWLDAQFAFDASSLTVRREGAPFTMQELSLAAMTQNIGLHLADTIAVIELAAQVCSAMVGDVQSAVAFSILQFRHQGIGSTDSVQPNNELVRCSSTSLVQAFAYLPENAFDLLLVDGAQVKQNAMTLLTTAIRQGNDAIVKECLSHISVSPGVLELLQSIPSPLEAGWILILRALPHAERQLLNGEKMSQYVKELFRRAIKYNQLQLVHLLTDCGVTFTQPDFVDILLAATETGQISTVKRVIDMQVTTPLTCTSGLDGPLHCASTHNFLSIAKVLLAKDASVSATGKDQDTPAHLAARNGHIDMLRLLLEANRKAVLGSMSASHDADRGGDNVAEDPKGELIDHMPPNTDDALEVENDNGSIPLEVAIRSGNEAIVSLLLKHTRRATVLERELVHIATRRGNVGLLQLLLRYQGLDLNRKSKDGWSALEVACSMGFFDVSQMLMEQGADAWPLDNDAAGDYPFARLCHIEDKSNATKIAGLLTNQRFRPVKSVLNSVLLYVAGTANSTLLATLLDAGADKNTGDGSQRTALHVCAYNGNEAAVRLLLMRGADPSTLDKYGDSPLADATARCHLGIIRLLLERGERYALDGADNSLMKLTRRGEIVALETILELQEDLCGTEVLNKCFHVALRHNEDKLVTLLLSYGVDPNFESAKRYYGSALHECAYYGNVTMARALLGHPGWVKDNMVNSLVGQYHTPLIAAVSWKYQKLSRNSRKIKPVKQRLIKQQKMVEYPIEQGGNPMIKGGRYGTMLNAAVAAGEPDLVTFILDKVGFDFHEEDDEGRSAAHIGCSALNERDTTDNLRVLCKKFGSSGLLLATDKHGRLPLHFACGSQRLDVLHYLLSDSMSKDKINEPDNDGWTPLHWACRQWDILLIRCLVDSHGAKTDCHTKDGWTPWDVAIFHDNSGFASALKRKDTTPDADGHVIKEGKRWSAVCNSCTVSQKILLLYTLNISG